MRRMRLTGGMFIRGGILTKYRDSNREVVRLFGPFARRLELFGFSVADKSRKLTEMLLVGWVYCSVSS